MMKFLFLIDKYFFGNEVAIVVEKSNTTRAWETMVGNGCILGAKP